MKLGEWVIWIMACISACVILILGFSVIPNARGKKGLSRKFAVALSLCLFWLTGLLGVEQRYAISQDKPEAGQKDEESKRLKEITKSREFKKLRKVWKELVELLKDRKPLTEELIDWRTKAEEGLKGKDLTEKDALLSKEKAIANLAFLTVELAKHIERLHVMVTCYMRVVPPQKRVIEEQKTLLEKAFREGKISQRVYEKVKMAMDAFEARGTVIGKNLSDANTVFLFKLMKEINSPPQIDITEISPELAKKIDEFVEKLGADDFKVREDAMEKLLEVGEPAIPALKKALNHKDAEVRWRAEVILKELE
jgi:hypothetical protein